MQTFLLRAFLDILSDAHAHTSLVGIFPGELLNHRTCKFSTLVNNAGWFSKVVVLIYTFTNSIGQFSPLLLRGKKAFEYANVYLSTGNPYIWPLQKESGLQGEAEFLQMVPMVCSLSALALECDDPSSNLSSATFLLLY